MEYAIQLLFAVLLALTGNLARAQSCPIIPLCPAGQGVIGIDPVLGTIVCDTVTTEIYSKFKRYIPADISPSLASYSRLGGSMSYFQDIDGDGRRELAVSAINASGNGVMLIVRFNADFSLRGYHEISPGVGGFTGTPNNPGSFMTGINNIGDQNGDGVEDFMVGEPSSNDGCSACGAAWILFMNTAGNVSSHVKLSSGVAGMPTLSANANFGWRNVALGDIDADGIRDIAVSAIGSFNSIVASGAVYILRFNASNNVKASTLITQGSGSFPDLLPTYSYFGYSLTHAGDLTGDGRVELVVGQQWVNGQPVGRANFLSLNSDGSVNTVVNRITQNSNFPGTLPSNRRIAISLSNFGDLSGDGRPEIAMGRGFDALYVLQVNTSAQITDLNAISHDNDYLTQGITTVTPEFGISSTILSDFNGDGLPEIAVGAQSDNQRNSPPFNGAITLFSLNNNVK